MLSPSIQVPGQWHMVYTPEEAVTTGGHLLTFDTLHLTEQARHFDHICEGLTNQDHEGTFPTLVRMMLAYPHMKDRGTPCSSLEIHTNTDREMTLVFYKKPLVAHSLMILKRTDYIPKGVKLPSQGKGTTDDITNAKNFARRILARLGVALSRCDEVLYSSGAYKDPGERVVLGDMWAVKDLTRLGLEGLVPDLEHVEPSKVDEDQGDGLQKVKARLRKGKGTAVEPAEGVGVKEKKAAPKKRKSAGTR